MRYPAPNRDLVYSRNVGHFALGHQPPFSQNHDICYLALKPKPNLTPNPNSHRSLIAVIGNPKL